MKIDFDKMKEVMELMAPRPSGPDLTCMSYWLPKLYEAKLPIPDTILVRLCREEAWDIFQVFDGKPITGKANPFFARLKGAADRIGYPCFLRTGHTSNKHSWERTCFLQTPDDLVQHVVALIEFSECCCMFGVPYDVWAVRGLLPTIPYGVCEYYGNMPICKEFRFFVDDGDVRCWHPYWPKDALKQGKAKFFEGFSYKKLLSPWGVKTDGPSPLLRLFELAEQAGKAVGGSWSVDLLETKGGWYITDMAEAKQSFHWVGCEFEKFYKID